MDEVDNSDSECAGEQEAADGKGVGDSNTMKKMIMTRCKDVRMKKSELAVQSSV